MADTVATCYPSVNSTMLVPCGSSQLSEFKIMENKEIRRANMLALVAIVLILLEIFA